MPDWFLRSYHALPMLHEVTQLPDPGLLAEADGELSLVAPSAEILREIRQSEIASGENPDREVGFWTEVARVAPGGIQSASAAPWRAPAYQLAMRIRPPACPPIRAMGRGEVTMVGGISLRIGMSEDLLLYSGQIGYGVRPFARGRRYAERACRLILPLAKRAGLTSVWITCNEDNTASRLTCERVGAELVEIVRLPEDHLLYQRGERYKCRYRIDL